MIRTAYDEHGVITGHYPTDEEYGEDTPERYIELSREEHRALCGHEHEYRVVDGALVPYTPPPPTLEELRAVKIAEIQAGANAAFRAMQAGYSEGEVASFEQQKLGARAILAGNMTDENALYVCGLADLRVQYGDVQLGALEGAERYAAFAARIEGNVQASMEGGKTILGIQQGLEVRARLATTVEELAAIVWPES